MNWTYAFATQPGPGKPESQDACSATLCGTTLIAVVADGAGSARFADRGAKIVVQSFIDVGPKLLEEADGAESLLKLIRLRVECAAAESDAKPDDFSSTLVGAVLSDGEAMFLQVGDGAVILSTDAGHVLAIEPEQTEFVNSTRFVTAEDAYKHLKVHRCSTVPHAVALFSDGLQPLLLDGQNRPHTPFFDAAFGNLKGLVPFDSRASEWIAKTLKSDPVTRRTDDDTSLVLARRVAP